MTECVRGCGLCCESISIKQGPDKIADYLEYYMYDHDKFTDQYYEREFILENWIYHGPDDINGHNYTCTQFNEKTRDCMAHDTRPNVCRNFPWYGKKPKKYRDELPNMCSFQADVRTMLPLVEVNGVPT